MPFLFQAPRPLPLSTLASNDTKRRMTGVLQTGVTVRRRDPTQRGHKSKMESCLSVKTRFDHKKWPEEVHQSQCPGHQPFPQCHPSFHVQPQDRKEIMTRRARVRRLIPGINTEIIFTKRHLHQSSTDRRRQRRSDGLSTDSVSCLRRARRRSLHMWLHCRVPNQGRSGRDVPGPGKGVGGSTASGIRIQGKRSCHDNTVQARQWSSGLSASAVICFVSHSAAASHRRSQTERLGLHALQALFGVTAVSATGRASMDCWRPSLTAGASVAANPDTGPPACPAPGAHLHDLIGRADLSVLGPPKRRA